VEYKNPINGGHTFLIMTCYLQMLMPKSAIPFVKVAAPVDRKYMKSSVAQWKS